MRVVAAVPVVGLLAGVGLGALVPDLPPPLVTTCFLGAAVAALVLFHINRAPLFAAAVSCSFFFGGTLLACRAWEEAWRAPVKIAFESIAHRQRTEAPGRAQTSDAVETASVILIGRLLADAAPTSGGGISLNIETEWMGSAASTRGVRDVAANPVSGGVSLVVGGDLARAMTDEWRAGRRIRTTAQLRRASVYLDPDVPNQERSLARRGVVLVGSVKSGALVELVERGNWIAEAEASARAFARRAIADAVGRWSPRSAAIVLAIVIGDRSELDPVVQTHLQEAGTYHVIAISGGNIAIFAAATFWLFRLVGVFGRTAMVTAMLVLIAYGGMVGGNPSVDRATWMAVMFLAGRLLDLRGPPANVLLVVAGILTLQHPLTVADPSFLLTFGATAALLAAAPDAEGTPRAKTVRVLSSMFMASLASEVALLPIAASFFARVTAAGLLLNFAAIPLMAVAQLAGMLVVPLFHLSPWVASGAGWIAHLGADGLVRSSELVTWMPWATWRVAPPSAAVIVAYYAALAAGWFVFRYRLPPRTLKERLLTRASAVENAVEHIALWRAGAVAAITLCAYWIAWHPLPRWRGDGQLHVTFLDVGQGDATFVRFPAGASMLVDAGGLSAGGAFDIGDRVVAPVLRRQNLRRLGTLVLTHGDGDHIGGAGAIVREFRPWDVWEGVPVPSFVPLQQLAAAVRAQSSRWTTIQTGDRFAIDDVTVIVHHPGLPDWERQQVRNDDAVVIEIRWRDLSVVLTGDIGRAVECLIAPRIAASPIRVLKAPHHGSATSSSESFLRALAPDVAIISAGRGNRYGHPAPVVVQRYASSKTRLLRTDEDGMIELASDGYSAWLTTFTGKELMVTSAVQRP
ncbi:MAG: DNA internalization-related competence protein ComEC/Rec2 [Acidobacteriaceae bacterium]|jgi:competence protein ComEC|nr:DNA internalization-related competence protein ComEC/Rec2 [Acidobacteriaceae bacterium]